MDGTGSVKVPDGKLVRVHATYDDRIESVRISGDFFLEPPEALEDLESALEGQPVDAPEDALREAVAGVDAQLIGFDAGDLAAATVEAVR
jgi:hypothetical protein